MNILTPFRRRRELSTEELNQAVLNAMARLQQRGIFSVFAFYDTIAGGKGNCFTSAPNDLTIEMLNRARKQLEKEPRRPVAS